MLPNSEIDFLVADVLDAIGLAVEGRTAAGFRKLVAGLDRAEQHRAAGNWWGVALVTRYREAVANYTARYGPPMRLSVEQPAPSAHTGNVTERMLARSAA